MRAKVELTNISAVEKFTDIVSTVDCDVRLVGKDENGNDWDISAKSLLCSLVVAQRKKSEREKLRPGGFC